MDARRWMWIVWPAFLAAAIMEMVVFAFVDPLDMRWLGASLDGSRNAVYTVAFFVFWAVSVISGMMTVMLGRSASDLNQGAGTEPLAE
ncbi:MAG: hypothetical protein LBV05_11165 [Comamonas sp.]|jgi:hypothetical protein|uniref:hypothetical protein n=1 Tax=Comamonas sp. TaxID=34028 RepID=UPI0025F78FFE|nr:hypothetical protein [Comamonas sp.]MDR3066050.1 hypothetical protein [Comamonas sp.]